MSQTVEVYSLKKWCLGKKQCEPGKKVEVPECRLAEFLRKGIVSMDKPAPPKKKVTKSEKKK